MSKNREERLNISQRQDRVLVANGVPSSSQLEEGLPVFRKVGTNIVQYIKVNNKIYQSIHTPLGT